MSGTTLILFDLGNVIAYIDFDAFWRMLGFNHPKDAAPFSDGYRSLTLQFETGHILKDKYITKLASIFDHRFNTARLEQAFASIMQEPVEGMLEIVKCISKNHQTALVSNTNEMHYQLSLRKYKALQLLSKHYLSFQFHVMKPEKGFYETIIKDQGIDSSEMLFIDDIAQNVEGAQAAGMHGVKFENTKQLIEVLKSYRLL